MQSIREVFRQTKLSEEVIDILMKSWTCGTSKQYSPHIQRWCEFCSSRNLNPFNATINDGAEFLTQYFLVQNVNIPLLILQGQRYHQFFLPRMV